MSAYWNQEIETMPREALRALQGKRLAATVKRLYENVPVYKAKLDEAGIAPEDVQSIDDLARLPFTYKQDLRDAYPFGLFAAPMSEVVRIHASSGTTGKQTVVGYTKNDLEIWSEGIARTLTAGGLTNHDIVHIAYGYGLFTGGLGVHYGAEKIGASVVPVSVGNTRRQIQILQDFGCTAICCTPSYALYLAETIEEMGIDPASLRLKTGFFGAEPWTESMRQEIERRLHVKAHDIYGLSEVIGPGVSQECECQCGLHVNEDHFVPEIIDPDTGAVLPEGVAGELVFTCITKEALPLLRYRTRDIATLQYGACGCGRTLVRMSKPAGRTDDMLIIRGVNVFPSQIESVLLEIPEAAPHYMLVVERHGNLDALEVQVEINEGFEFDQVRRVETLERRIRAAIESTLGIAARVRLLPPRTLPRSEGKAKRVDDRRSL